MAKDPGEATATRYEAAPDTEERLIEPVESIQGAERYESDGISIDVPQGLTIERTEAAADTAQFAMKEPGRERAIVTLTVTTGQNATDAEIDAASLTNERKFLASGIPEVRRATANWDGWPYAVTTELKLPVETDGQAKDVDLIMVMLRSDTGAVIVTASAEADPGELEDSLAFEALRTLRQAE